MISMPDRRAEAFFLGPAMLISEHSQLSAPGPPSLLAPDLGGLLLFRRLGPSKLGLDFIQQDSSRQETIQRLRAFFLAPDPDAGRQMVEHHTG